MGLHGLCETLILGTEDSGWASALIWMAPWEVSGFTTVRWRTFRCLAKLAWSLRGNPSLTQESPLGAASMDLL